MTTSITPQDPRADLSWNRADRVQEVADRADAVTDLRRWTKLDEEYDAKRAGEFEREIDRAFGLDGAR
jgi:hypothetical protein